MARIIINKEYEVEGHFSFEISIDKNTTPRIVNIKGAFKTNEYLPDISTIENERYQLDKVSVYTESFGSDEDQVIYLFTAGRFNRKKYRGDENEGKK